MSVRNFFKLQREAFISLLGTFAIRGQAKLVPKWVEIQSGPLIGMRLCISDMFEEMATGDYDAFIYRTIAQHSINLDHSTVWDVGAHIGYHTLAFSKMVGGDGRVCAFEPNPYNLDRLKSNLAANAAFAKNVDVYTFALSDADEIAQFQINRNVDNTKSSGSYLDYGSLPSDRYGPEVFSDFVAIEIQVFKPDTLVFEMHIPVPKLIKLDIEGAEYRFIEGSARLIDAFRPMFIIEVHHIQNLFYLYEALSQKGYALFLLDDTLNASSRCYILATAASGRENAS